MLMTTVEFIFRKNDAIRILKPLQAYTAFSAVYGGKKAGVDNDGLSTDNSYCSSLTF